MLHCNRPRNPDFPEREDLFRYKNFAGLQQTKEEKHTSAATLTMEADVEEESMHTALPFS
jgi:hypothetical protein